MGTWIEMFLTGAEYNTDAVVPYVGTWIEIEWSRLRNEMERSRSLRGNVDRNIDSATTMTKIGSVVPYVGTWIEIPAPCLSAVIIIVVPYVGTWIEIFNSSKAFLISLVVPYVGTWIEISMLTSGNPAIDVVPYVGTWIEIQ